MKCEGSKAALLNLYNHNIITKIDEFKFVPLAPVTKRIYLPRLTDNILIKEKLPPKVY
ncbi:MAG: hypothetical protein ACD_20C00058G0004 [uncultured bacterium]|nr:MAG: hypothetical protein ACD_20C00058G0004 [uncultured bacterium]